MQWEKLERSFQVLEAVLRSLQARRPVQPAVVQHRHHAVCAGARRRRHGGGREGARLRARRPAAWRHRSADRARRGARSEPARAPAIATSSCSATPAPRTGRSRTRSSPPGMRPGAARCRRPPGARTYLFGIGDDANVPLLKMLSRDDGVMDTVRSTEPIEFKSAGVRVEDRRAPARRAADDRRSAGRHRSRVSARSGVVCRVGRVLGRPLHAAGRPRDLHRPRRARQPRDRDARHGGAPGREPGARAACRGRGRRRASTRCSTRSRATARTAPASTKSSSSRGSTSS